MYSGKGAEKHRPSLNAHKDRGNKPFYFYLENIFITIPIAINE